ncbi:spore germination protein GerPE [Bacillus sp. REN10]|uniref:spore germination protein GerPE n=1 Tax=Bacillus sp. REN10 TaxID=2782541 RepID=UPI00193C10E5|nr:spore germination protein GerPE [Bacillus sp. REN10]
MRLSIVDHLLVNTVFFSSILEIGDTNQSQAYSTVYAVQEPSKDFLNTTQQPSIVLPPPTVICQKKQQNTSTIHAYPFIHIGHVHLIGVSTSAVVLIGSANEATGYCRIQHVRKLKVKK